MTEIAEWNCENCGASSAADYCGSCGQRRAERLQWWPLIQGGWHHFVDLDSPFAHTFLSLWRNPGRAAREYIRGRRKAYVNPAKYALIPAFPSFWGHLLVLLLECVWLTYGITSLYKNHRPATFLKAFSLYLIYRASSMLVSFVTAAGWITFRYLVR